MLRMCASNSHSYTHLIQALGIVRKPTVWVFITSKYPGTHDIGLPTTLTHHRGRRARSVERLQQHTAVARGHAHPSPLQPHLHTGPPQHDSTLAPRRPPSAPSHHVAHPYLNETLYQPVAEFLVGYNLWGGGARTRDKFSSARKAVSSTITSSSSFTPG